jgi:hypothetical protein
MNKSKMFWVIHEEGLPTWIVFAGEVSISEST